eukprot:m.58662 g.58662  ORF g.58662 m.58662 type:complete len:89 (+) comp9421_c0_seq1:4105-4371(+)
MWTGVKLESIATSLLRPETPVCFHEEYIPKKCLTMIRDLAPHNKLHFLSSNNCGMPTLDPGRRDGISHLLMLHEQIRDQTAISSRSTL